MEPYDDSLMGRDEDLARITDGGLVAIVRLKAAAPLIAVAEAVVAGGVDVVEFTMTTPGALEVLREASRSLGNTVLLGAGTVLDAETVRKTVDAGARFIVSPTLSTEVIEATRREGVVSCPGTFTPTEILTAYDAGADLIKVFPAASLGSRFISDVLAPLPYVKLVATGGIGLENAAEFISAGAVAIGVSRNLVDDRLVAAGDFASITERGRFLVGAIREAREIMTASAGGAAR